MHLAMVQFSSPLLRCCCHHYGAGSNIRHRPGRRQSHLLLHRHRYNGMLFRTISSFCSYCYLGLLKYLRFLGQDRRGLPSLLRAPE